MNKFILCVVLGCVVSISGCAKSGNAAKNPVETGKPTTMSTTEHKTMKPITSDAKTPASSTPGKAPSTTPASVQSPAQIK